MPNSHLSEDQNGTEDLPRKLINWTSQQDRLKRIKQASILLECSTICPFQWMKHNYMCIYCDEKFPDPETLNTHNATHNLTHDEIEVILNKTKKYIFVKVNVRTVSCKLCGDEIQNLNELRVHLLKTHRKNIDLDSSDGVLPFKVSKTDFDCALCTETFEEYTTLNNHMNVHYPNFICEQCGTGFITPERLRAHRFSHETGTFPCDGCNKVFKSNNSKNEHFDRVHKKVKRHRCPKCGENFKNYYQRNKHVSTVHGLKLKEFQCGTCNKVFTTSGKLGIHKRTVHLKEKRYACDFCEWKFFSKTELESHMIRHGGERKYQCAVCKKAYARKYTLTEHIKIHENDKRFICTLCGRAFVQNCSLKHHFRFHHPTAIKKGESYDNA